jgi:nucleoside-diphosphate-sugar epimerase
LKVLVTGAAGFIGSHLVRALLQDGYAVRAIDNLSTGQKSRLDDVINDIEWMEADLCDPDASARAAAGVDGVLHQAAIPSVSRSITDPVASSQSNVTGTITLLQACREAGVPRFVMAASSSAYGSSPSLPKVETMCPAPLSPYAVSKLAAEQYCQVFGRLGYVETVCLRYFNVYGPRQDPASQYAAVVPKFICALLAGQPLTIDGDGSQSRDFTYIDNVIQANKLALSAPGVSGEVFNVGCGSRYDLNFLVRELASIIEVEPTVEFLPGRPGDVPHSLADITKARQLLKYEPAIDFREGLKRTVAWYRNQTAGTSAVLSG